MTPKQAAAMAMKRQEALDRARGNFSAFVETVVRDEKGRLFRLAPHHRAWHAHIDYCWARGLHAGIMAPRSHGKSSGLIAPLICFMLGNDPNLRTKIISNSDEEAKKRVALVGRTLKSATFRRMFPHVYPGLPWSTERVCVNRPGWAIDASCEAKGVTSIGVGGRCERMLLDDAVDEHNSAGEIPRKRILNLLDNTWMNLLTADGLACALATPWFAGDAWEILKTRPGGLWLIQRISPDLDCIEQELVGVDAPDHPGRSAVA